MFEYRSVLLVSGYWTAQRYEETGTGFTGPQVLGTFQTVAGGQGGNDPLTAKDQADALCGGLVAEFGGIFDPDVNTPFLEE